MWFLRTDSKLRAIPSPPTPAALETLLHHAIAAQDWLEAATLALFLRAAQPQTAQASFRAILAGARQTQQVGAVMPSSLPSKLSAEAMKLRPFHVGATELLGLLHNQVCSTHQIVIDTMCLQWCSQEFSARHHCTTLLSC